MVTGKRIAPLGLADGFTNQRNDCVNIKICETFGRCSKNCTHYKSKTEVIDEEKEVNEKALDDIKALIKKKNRYMTITCQILSAGMLLNYCDNHGYEYIDNISYGLTPSLIFRLKEEK
jgi:hypothetical protein